MHELNLREAASRLRLRGRGHWNFTHVATLLGRFITSETQSRSDRSVGWRPRGVAQDLPSRGGGVDEHPVVSSARGRGREEASAQRVSEYLHGAVSHTSAGRGEHILGLLGRQHAGH